MILKDRVREFTDYTGTGDDITVTGATGADVQTFDNALEVGAVTVITIASGSQWAVGLVEYTATDTLTWLEVWDGTDGEDTRVDFTSGQKRIWIDRAAAIDALMLGVHMALRQGVYL